MNDPASVADTRIYRFADCVVDAGRRQLHRARELIDLQPKAFDLLVYLIEHRERAVDKDELQAAVWPNVIVTDASLTKAVQRARLAVGDDSERQTVIGTVHGHGYRFVAVVADGTDGEPAAVLQPAADAAATSPAKAERRWPLWIAAAVMAAVIAYGSFRYGADTTRAVPVRVAVLPVENGTGDAELDWARLGLMSVIADSLRKSNLGVVDDGDVVRLASVSTSNTDTRSADWLQDTLREAHGATYLVSTRLERDGEVYRMRSLLKSGGRDDDSALFAGQDLLQLARNTAGRVAATMRREKPRPDATTAISADPHVNESYARGRALELEGRCNEAQALFSAAIVQEPQLIEPKIAYASCARILGETETAERTFREVLQALEKRPADAPATRHLQATVLLRLGILLNRTGRLDESDTSYVQAEQLARGLGDTDLVGLILVNRAYIAEDRSQFELARDHLMRALGLFQDAKRPLVPGNLYGALANIDIDQGRLEDADRHYSRAIEIFRRIGDRRNEAMMLNNQGLLKREQGYFDDAETLHRASREIREQLGDRQGLGRVDDMLALVHLARGEFDAALPLLASALAIAREGNDRFYEAVTLGHRGEAQLGAGRLDLAQRDLLDAVGIFESLGNRAYVLQLSVTLAEIERRRGKPALAERFAREILDAARAEEQDLAAIDALRLLASAAADRNDRVQRTKHLEDALNRARTIGHQGKVIGTSIELARSHLEANDTIAAQPLLGTLVDAPESYDLMRLRASWAFARKDTLGAIQAMQRARELAGQRWTDADVKAMAAYQSVRN
ncbi:MAG: tetratricopeptide repeat protein [Steroidobacteraceae bacterium]